MRTKFDSNDKIGAIVAMFTGASDIFYNYNIDFCCGGHRQLKEAILEQKLDESKILEALNSGYAEFDINNNKFIDWAKETPEKLIDHVLSTHHAFLRDELPKLSDYTFKIMKVHGKNHIELFKVHRLFNNLITELEEHLVKEEEFVFPLIKQYKETKTPELKDEIMKLVNELEHEHVGAGDILKELRELTNHYSVPEDACKTFEITYNKLKEVEMDLFNHIHLENNILFKNL